jgi:hypothetical protein
MLGWYLHPEAPGSDHIFYAFYLAAKEFGLPDFIYVDNGKDFRHRDLTGCYKNFKTWNEATEAYAKSLMGMLNVEVVFATAYNAQAKSLERDFKKIIEQFSKLMKGYTGSNPAKRPESTREACAKGALMSYEECSCLLDKYMKETFNRTASNGQLLKGLCPDEAFEKYRKSMRTVSVDSLRLCAMRTSKPKRIGRNGVVDTELGIELRYWAEWMPSVKGDMVYMRRDIRNYQECWIWNERGGVFLGKAVLAETIAMRATAPLEKLRLKEEIARKRADLRDAKLAIKSSVRLNGQEIIESLSAGTQALNDKRGWTPNGSQENVRKEVHLTELDHAVAQENRREKTGTYDLASIAPPPREKKMHYRLFPGERFDDEIEESKAG